MSGVSDSYFLLLVLAVHSEHSQPVENMVLVLEISMMIVRASRIFSIDLNSIEIIPTQTVLFVQTSTELD
jgi:hypothetical protein